MNKNKTSSTSSIQHRSSAASAAPPASRHWARSSTIDLGITVSHRLSDKSMIRYPAFSHPNQQQTKKISQQLPIPQHLPKLRLVPPQQQQLLMGKHSDSVACDRAVRDVASQSEKKNQALPKITSAQYPMMVSRSELVAAAVDHEEVDRNEDAEWTALQQESLSKTALDICTANDVIDIKAGKDQRIFRVAKAVLFQSITLEHIYSASRNHFREKTTGICLNSLPSGQHFTFVLEYLNRTYLRKKNIDLSMYRKFDIPSEYVIDIMEFSLYLDLSPLVDQCAVLIARQNEGMDD